MSPLTLSCIIFVLVFGGIFVGALLRLALPGHHLSKESQDVVRLGAGLIATIAGKPCKLGALKYFRKMIGSRRRRPRKGVTLFLVGQDRSFEMCDYSLHNVKTRPAKVGDKLTTRLFSSGTRGFSAPEDKSMAVCLLPGTELSFTDKVRRVHMWPWGKDVVYANTAIFRQINQDCPMRHHDALEFPDGRTVLLTFLQDGQHATILQLPTTAIASGATQRIAYAIAE